MNAIVISCGDELVTGQTVDTNSAYLSARLARRGIATVEHLTVGDDRTAIAAAIGNSAVKVPLVLLTGGLGPTADDLARQALADAMGGAELVLDAQCLAEIESFFRLRNRAMCDANRVQAMIPRGASPLVNDVGTAPGIFARIGGCDVYVMPGVPSEMRRMYERVVEPRLPSASGVIVYRAIHTFGAGESDVGTAIADLMQRGANPLVGTTVAAGMVSIRLVARADDEPAALNMIDGAAREIRSRLGALVVGENDQTMASVLGELLRSRRQTLATAESCTGGMIGQMITAVAGSSDYYRGGAVAYANDAKTAMLSVDPAAIARDGAVSQVVAQQMAAGARERFAADWALSVTGIAGPAGGTPEKPVGLVYIGLAGPQESGVFRHVLPGTREVVRLRASLTTMNHLRLALLQERA